MLKIHTIPAMNDTSRPHASGCHCGLAALFSRLPGSMQGYPRLVAVSIVIGLVAGVATHILNLLLHFIAGSITSSLNPQTPNPILIVLPVIGLLLTVAYTRYIIRMPLAHGTERIRAYLKEKDYALPPRLMWASVLGSSVTLGFGGSAGAEGPSAYTGAAIASNFGRWLRLDRPQMRAIIGIGAGAGIAGIFRSPIGGVLFTLEVLAMPLSTRPVIALITCCLTSGLCSYILAGQTFDVNFFQSVKPQAADFWVIIILGVICGLYSIYYTYVFNLTGNRLERFGNPWIRAIAAGLMIGLAIFIFPSLYATGYDTLDRLLEGDRNAMVGYGLIPPTYNMPLLLAMTGMGIIFIKPFACSATNYGGGVAGNFAPTLFAGGILGFVFATLANVWLGADLHVPNYILLGMAGAMSGVIRAPMMSIFLCSEMANRSSFLWPLSVVALISWLVRNLLADRLRGV